MSIPTLLIPQLDPNLKTGPTRIMSGPVRMGSVTPGTAYGEFATWLYVGGSGNVSIRKWDGTTIVMIGMIAGVWHPVYSTMVNSSGTTATNLLWGS